MTTVLTIRPGVSVRPGVTLQGKGPVIDSTFTFTLASANFDSYQWGDLQNVTHSSFTVPGPGRQFSYCQYQANLGSGYNANQTYYSNLSAAWTAAGLLTDGSKYAFNVTWGAGGTPSSTVVFASFDIYGPTEGRLVFAPVYTGNNDWQTPGTNIVTLVGAEGDYNLPVTFTLISPEIQDNGAWC
jgi:hypothetical protein